MSYRLHTGIKFFVTARGEGLTKSIRQKLKKVILEAPP